MAGITNKGKYQIFSVYYRGATPPTYFYLALFTSATAPTADTNTFSELTEITAGNGYVTGGYELDRNSTDFDVLTEDDGNDRALIQLFDVTWSALGGSIPNGGSGARYACLTDDNATQASRLVEVYFDLVSDRSVTDGQDLTIQNAEIRLNES